MRYYLKHLLELYVSYMKLAFSGLVLSSLLLFGYSAFKTENILFGFTIVLVLLAILVGIINLQRRPTKFTSESEQRESQRREAEAAVERTKQRLEEARKYLESTRKSREAMIGDFQEAMLVHELVILMEQLQSLNANELLIDKAVQQFLILQEKLGDSSTLATLREKVFDSIKGEIVCLPPHKEREGRKVAG
jgi:hypothetical protein